MRWGNGRESDNVEDQRASGGGGGGMGSGIAGGGIGMVVIAVVAMFLGVDPSMILGLLGGRQPAPVSQSGPAPKPPAQDQAAKFVSVVLADTEDT